MDTKETNVVKESPFIGILRDLFHSKSAQLYEYSFESRSMLGNFDTDNIYYWDFNCRFILFDANTTKLPDVMKFIVANPLFIGVHDIVISHESPNAAFLTLIGTFSLDLIKDRFHKITEYTKEELELFIIEHQSSMLIEL